MESSEKGTSQKSVKEKGREDDQRSLSEPTLSALFSTHPSDDLDGSVVLESLNC